MTPQDPVLNLLREHVAEIVFGSVFLFLGMAACCVAAIRRRGEVRVLVWFGLFIGMFGLRMLADVTTILGLVPASSWPLRVSIGVDYLVLIPALLFWNELCAGPPRKLIQLLAIFSAAIATIEFVWYLRGGSPYQLLGYNNVLAIGSMVIIGGLAAVPRLARRYLMLKSKILQVIMPALALVALCVNAMWLFGTRPPRYVEPVTFAVWVLAIGYEAAKRTFENERRLLSIESELEMARQIQASILPERIPAVEGLRIAASYHSMSAVAGDFYQFLQSDDGRIGILVADVTGHGVPAALIASMIKVAMQSVACFAAEPARLMGNLNRVLTPELRGRLTSAAYLWMDTKAGCALYSGAGHPALRHCKGGTGEVLHIESNGVLFGVDDGADYPEQSLSLGNGDRLLLYTDGLIEPENAQGEAFGERELDRVFSGARTLMAPEWSADLLSALRNWQPASLPQQDDITMIAVDVLEVLRGATARRCGLSN